MVVNEFRKTLACVAWLFFREHYSFVGSTTDWAPGRKNASLRSRRLGYAGYKNARERGAISSRFLCPSLPADVLWGSFVTHHFSSAGSWAGRQPLACVARVSNRVIARKLERKQKKGANRVIARKLERKQKKGWRRRGRGEEETLARKPHDSGKRPLIFHGSVHL